MNPTGRSRSAAPRLDERSSAVLRTLIHEHVVRGEPIGSKTVARGIRLKLSPASIRAIMAELEERGLLSQPHRSAGRVPTDRAYRVYVDHMIGKPRVAISQAQAIDRAMARSGSEIEGLLGEASRQLSHFSRQVGLVVPPDMRRIIVDHLEFIRLDPRRVMAILVGRSGVVHNRILDSAEGLPQEELDRIGRYLSAELGGRTLPEIRELLRSGISADRAVYDKLVCRSLELGSRAVEPDEHAADLFVEGTSNLVGRPEFADQVSMRALLKTLEEKRTLIRLLGQVLEGKGVQVVIGEENPLADLTCCSLVAATYGIGEQTLGTLGIVGPIRMEYPRAMALVDYLARALTTRLTPRH